ncbi:MAG: hypothetical protein ABIT01_10005 [Thermoanaerobaculia bacterium]
MSSSELSDASRPAKVIVHFIADPVTETFVIDHAFSLRARGVGAFTASLAPGLYKIKFRRGEAIAETHVEVSAGSAAMRVEAPVIASSSSVPFRASGVTDEQLLLAHDISSGSAVSFGRGAHVLFFVRSAADALGDAPPAQGLTLHTLDGQLVFDLQAAASGSAECAGLLAELEPGAYRLRADCNGTLEQIVVATKDWQTQVFLLRQLVNELPRIDLRSTSVLMSKDPFDPSDEMLSYAEAARSALAGGRSTMTKQLLNSLIEDKVYSPMLGLYAAAALTSADDERQRLRLLDTLQRLLPAHPDVLALSLEIAPAAEPISIPPMLRRSWQMITAATLDDRASLEPGSLPARVPSTVLGGTPWLIWPEDALLPATDEAADTSQLLTDLQKLLDQRGPEETEDLEEVPLTESESAVFSYLGRRASLQHRMKVPSTPDNDVNVTSLAKAFGTTRQDVKAAVDGLAGKILGATRRSDS